MVRKILIYGAIPFVLIAVWLIFFNNEEVGEKMIEVEVKSGLFEVIVTTTGELQAENSEEIRGPSGLRKVHVYQVKITDLVPEGTLVDSGDYVATLDRTEAETRLKDVESNLQTAESQLIKTQLDTTLELRNARDELINLKYQLEETKIVLEQSVYEPPATIRQAQISYDKAQRNYDQALSNYKLKVKQAEANMLEATMGYDKDFRKKEEIEAVLEEFVVRAPKQGMVIYKRQWGGEKRKVGSEISAWDPSVATLPDLSSMISKTYVNEIDISKIEVGMPVRIGVDAFPEKSFSGKITEVANIGEQLPNSEAKVFEVLIKVNESDSILRPAMTTGNSILVARYDSVLYVPLEAVHSNDTISYVFLNGGFSVVKQVVITGPSNENEIIIRKGLSVGDVVLLSTPDDPESIDIKGIDLIMDNDRKVDSEKKKSIDPS